MNTRTLLLPILFLLLPLATMVGCSDDAGTEDSGAADTGAADSSTGDSGGADSGGADSGSADSGSADSGSTDSGSTDSGSADSGSADSGAPCIGTVDPSDTFYDRFEGTGLNNGCAQSSDCMAGGCSSEVCAAEAAITTCEGLPYTPTGSCRCVAGACTWATGTCE